MVVMVAVNRVGRVRARASYARAHRRAIEVLVMRLSVMVSMIVAGGRLLSLAGASARAGSGYAVHHNRVHRLRVRTGGRLVDLLVKNSFVQHLGQRFVVCRWV